MKSPFEKIEEWNKKGLYLPFVHDAESGKPSITLLFAYTTFTIAASSVIACHWFPHIIPSTLVSIGFWAMATIFYRMRKLDSAKIDLKNDSISVQGDGPSANQDSAPAARSDQTAG